MADQPDPLAGGDRDRQLVEQRVRMRAIAEGDAIEHDRAMADPYRRRIDAIMHTERLSLHLHQLFHLVHRALQIADVKSSVAQIPMDYKIARQHVSDVARRRMTVPA